MNSPVTVPPPNPLATSRAAVSISQEMGRGVPSSPGLRRPRARSRFPAPFIPPVVVRASAGTQARLRSASAPASRPPAALPLRPRGHPGRSCRRPSSPGHAASSQASRCSAGTLAARVSIGFFLAAMIPFSDGSRGSSQPGRREQDRRQRSSDRLIPVLHVAPNQQAVILDLDLDDVRDERHPEQLGDLRSDLPSLRVVGGLPGDDQAHSSGRSASASRSRHARAYRWR